MSALKNEFNRKFKRIYIENKTKYLLLVHSTHSFYQIGGKQPYTDVDFTLDYRDHPEKYIIGKGQFGVLMYEPYKSEILPYWRYKNEKAARKSAKKIYELFKKYVTEKDFVGADMAKKFLHMGNTRSLRYAKYPGGVKYKDGKQIEPIFWADEQKYLASNVFRKYLNMAIDNKQYQIMRQKHLKIQNDKLEKR